MIKIKILNEKEKLKGGAGDNKSDNEFDPKQLALGVEDETGEHAKDPEIGKEIAKDHLFKDPDYYRKLKAAGIEESQEKIGDYNHKKFMDWFTGRMEKETAQKNNLLIETKLSKYWKKRAKLRALRAERQWPNKHDRDWALEEQEKSLKMNDKIYALFEKELEDASNVSDNVSGMMRRMKKSRKEYLKKREEKKLQREVELMHPRERTKKVGGASQSISTKPEYGGVKKGFDKKRKQAAKKGQVAIAPGAQFGPMEEEKKNENK